ncbi:hypothetical protein AMECASPLE_022157 [Ameca splendens]|uniref:Spondin-1 n=1 Tax=Ameca splendens TaxID=208324 RepID=A0ABV0XSW0_9TELE
MLRRSSGPSVPQSDYDESRLAIPCTGTGPLSRRSSSPPLHLAGKPTSSSRRRKHRHGAPSCGSAGEEAGPMAAVVRAASNNPASSPAAAPSPRLAAALTMPSSLASAEVSVATTVSRELLQLSPRQISRALLLPSGPRQVSRALLLPSGPRQVSRALLLPSSPRQVSRALLLPSSPRQVSRALLLPSSPRQVSRALLLLSSPRQVSRDLLLSSPRQVFRELLPSSPRQRDALAQVTEGPGDASAPAQVTEGLGDPSAPAHAAEGLGDPLAPAPGLSAFQGFKERLVLILASETGDEGFEDELPPDPVPEWSVERLVLIMASDEGLEDEPVPERFENKLSPNKPTIPQEKIRSLTSLDHPQSPFYDPEGGAIAPVARVVVERITRKGEQCNVVPDTIDDIVADIGQEEKEEDDTPETCIYSPWSPWSACSSATCDKGRRMRQRMLKAQLDLSVPCPHTQDFQPCMAPGCSMEELSTCMMSEWISWSACSVSCGMGMRSRERYVKQYPEDGSLCQLQTEETEKCVVNDECSDSSCVVTEWGEWDPCSVTCGVGMRRRERMVKMPPIDGSMCKTEVAEVEKCMMPECREFTLILNIVLLVTTHVFLLS